VLDRHRPLVSAADAARQVDGRGHVLPAGLRYRAAVRADGAEGAGGVEGGGEWFFFLLHPAMGRSADGMLIWVLGV
jgi:hypothetical protein